MKIRSTNYSKYYCYRNFVTNYTKLFLSQHCSGIATVPEGLTVRECYRSFTARIQIHNSGNMIKFKLGKTVLFHCFEISQVIAFMSKSLSVQNYCLAYVFLKSCWILLRSSCFNMGWLVHIHTYIIKYICM